MSPGKRSVAIFLLIHVAAWAGNGSSGVGNMIRVDGSLYSRVSKDQITRQGDLLIDSETGEPLLQITEISAADLAQDQPNLVRATLGKTHGFEFVPDRDPTFGSWKGYWVVPSETPGKWIRLRPKSRTNAMVAEVLGGLFINTDSH